MAFFIVFLVSGPLYLATATRKAPAAHSSPPPYAENGGPTHHRPPEDPLPYAPSEHIKPASSSPVPLISLATMLISFMGTVSTMYFSWRTDRRTARESDLKVIQMQQQIVELQTKLISGQNAVSSSDPS
jgi:hypothetical protein